MSEFIPYNYIGEIAGLLTAGLLLFVMLYTKPRITFVYKYIFRGVVLSIFSIIVQVIIIEIANNPGKYYNAFLFTVLLLTFLLLYNGILFCIFSYVNLMSIVRRSQRKEFLVIYAILSFTYLVSVIVEMASRGLYEVSLEGHIDITHFTRFYCAAGIICAVVCFEASISNIKTISRVVWHAVCLFTPIDIVILLMQMLSISSGRVVFSAITYVIVFALGYLMFHSNPYDELTGCQNAYALSAYTNKYAGKKKFYVTYSCLLTPPIDNFTKNDIDYAFEGVVVCRSIEAISKKIKLFSVDEIKYVNIIETDDENEARDCAEKTRAIFDRVKANASVPVNYVMVTGEVNKELDSDLKVRQFFQFVAKRFETRNSSVFYFTKPNDYDDFKDNYEMIVALKDIKNRLNYDDERVLVYAQPIYSVETGSFRIAEALMRLKIGDRIISPDKFIPVAESSGCIHALTAIILNKVCKAIEQLDEYYDFDAISINCSSKELSQENMYSELLDIIDKHNIPTNKIRLEVTESAMFENYDIANMNMTILTDAGIQFYLDDFGTGYSSLERVINCPFKTIKFDKALLYKALDDDRMADIMKYMIEVFKRNGFITLVEGVEDESQNQYSVEHGFEFIQGYHYARPVPLMDIKKYFTRKNSF